MKRFVSYLYAVDHQQKTKNAGFARIEQRPGRNRIEIHLRDSGYGGKSGNVYLYLRKDGILHGFFLGNIDFRGNQADFQYIQADQYLPDTEYTIDQMNGILIQLNRQTLYLSQWDDEEVIDLSTFRVWQAKKSEQDKKDEMNQKNLEKENKIEKNHLFSEKTQEKNLPVEKMKGNNSYREEKEENQSLKEEKKKSQKEILQLSQEESSVRSTGLSASVQLKKEESWEEKWRRMLDSFPHMDGFPKEKDARCIRIELKDIRLLPQQVWSIMNNSFLLHGFFNYRYLLFGRCGQKWIVGVPGIFQNQEHVMASIFGFPDFLQKSEPEEAAFGYWYRELELGQYPGKNGKCSGQFKELAAERSE